MAIVQFGSSSSFDAASFAELAEALHAAGDTEETADQVIATAVGVLDADHASITLLRRAYGLETLASTDPMVVQLDQLQHDLRDGPCHDDSWRGQTLLSPDLPNDARWPDWAPKAAAHGIASMLAVELATPERRVGTLNLYFTRARKFSPDDIAFASIFGRHASVAVANKTEQSELIVALDSRKLIGQAQGILMERYDLSENQAFDVLKRYSQDHNTKLRTVARELIANRKLPDGRSTDSDVDQQ